MMSDQSEPQPEARWIVLPPEKYELWTEHALVAFCPRVIVSRDRLQTYGVKTGDIRYFTNMKLLEPQPRNMVQLKSDVVAICERRVEERRQAEEPEPDDVDVLTRDQALFDNLPSDEQVMFRFFLANLIWRDTTSNRFTLMSLRGAPYTKAEIVDLVNSFGYDFRTGSSDITAPNHWKDLVV